VELSYYTLVLKTNFQLLLLPINNGITGSPASNSLKMMDLAIAMCYILFCPCNRHIVVLFHPPLTRFAIAAGARFYARDYCSLRAAFAN